MMKFTIRVSSLLAVLLIIDTHLSSVSAQGTAFAYQGRLQGGGIPVGGSYDLRFTIFDSATNGNQLGPVLTNAVTAISNGLFTVTLDFGNQFSGADRFLEIAVQTNGGNTFTTLSPRQHINPTPYAITAGNVIPGSVPFSGLSASAQAQLTNAANGAAAAAINSSSIATNLPGNIAVTVLPTGKNDTFNLQALLTNGCTVNLVNTNVPYYASNLYFGCNCTLNGNGATIVNLNQVPGAHTNNINNIIDRLNAVLSPFPYNGQSDGFGLTNVTIRDLNIVNPNTYNYSFGSLMIGNVGSYRAPQNYEFGEPWTNVCGIQYNVAAGGALENITVRGFPGYGIILENTNGQFAYSHPMSIIHGLTCYNNYIGCYPRGDFTSPPWYGWNASVNTSGDDDSAEYTDLSDCYFVHNTVGLIGGYGNFRIINDKFTDNYIGDLTTSGAGTFNSGHGLVSGCTFNHNALAGMYIGGGLSGGSIIGCLFINSGIGAPYDIFIDGSPNWNVMSSVVGTVIVTNVPGTPGGVGAESFYGNQYLNLISASTNLTSYITEPYGAGPLFNQTNAAGGIVSLPWYAATNPIVPGTLTGTFSGNGYSLTNLNATQLTGTLATANLPGITTNVSAAGITFYITNGLIMRVGPP
jgi:hypothetical protein